MRFYMRVPQIPARFAADDTGRDLHEVTDLCRVHHCFSHDRDEPVPDRPTGILCPECMHYYPSARRMVWRYRWDTGRVFWADLWAPRRVGVSAIKSRVHALRHLIRMMRQTGRTITFCTHCLADFE